MRGIISILKKLKVDIKKGAYQKALAKDVHAHLFHKQEPDPGPALDLGAHIWRCPRLGGDSRTACQGDKQVCWSVLLWN